MALKTDYVDDELAVSMGGKRQFNIVDSNGNILYENVHIEDTSKYSTVGDDFGAEELNEIDEVINSLTDKTLLASGSLSAAGDSYTFPSDMTLLVYRIVKTGYYGSQAFFSYPKINDGGNSRCIDFDNTKFTFKLNTTAISTPTALTSGYTIEYRAYK